MTGPSPELPPDEAFTAELAALTAEHDNDAAWRELHRQLFPELLGFAEQEGIEIGAFNGYALSAISANLAATDLIPDAEERQASERNILLDLAALLDPPMLDMIMKFRGAAPFTDEERAIIENKVIKATATEDLLEGIRYEIGAVLPDDLELATEVTLFLHHLSTHIYIVRHHASEAERAARSQTFIEINLKLIEQIPLDSKLRSVVIALLRPETEDSNSAAGES